MIDRLISLLVRVVESDFLPPGSYLAGGTAVYLYLRHRISIDLDFFTQKTFRSDALIPKMRERFKHVEVELMEKDTLIVYLTEEKIKFSLFSLPYKLLSDIQHLTVIDPAQCPLASLEDLEAMKTISIVQRGSAKDFVDLYYLMKKTNHSFEDIFSLVQKKYDLNNRYEYQLKTSFVYFDDAEKEIDEILLVDKHGVARKISPKEWGDIKNKFMRINQ